MTVGHLVGEVVRRLLTSVQGLERAARVVGDGVVGVYGRVALRPAEVEKGYRERIAVGIGVVPQNIDRDRRVFVGRGGIRNRIGRLIARSTDRETDRCGRSRVAHVLDRVGEARGSAVARIRGEYCATGLTGKGDCAVDRASHRIDGKCLVVGVGVVAEQCRERDVQHGSGRRGKTAVVVRNRRIVHRIDGDVDGPVGRAVAVREGIGERSRAVVVCGRCEDDAPGIEHDGTVCGATDAGDRQRIALRIGVIGH